MESRHFVRVSAQDRKCPFVLWSKIYTFVQELFVNAPGWSPACPLNAISKKCPSKHFLVGEVELGLLADVDLLGGGTGLLHLEAAGEEVVAAGQAGAGGDGLGDGELVAAGVVVGELGDGPSAGGVLAGAVGDLGQLAVGGQHGRALDGGGLAVADLDNSEGVTVGGVLAGSEL